MEADGWVPLGCWPGAEIAAERESVVAIVAVGSCRRGEKKATAMIAINPTDSQRIPVVCELKWEPFGCAILKKNFVGCRKCRIFAADFRCGIRG